jgi:hypothetical protein
MKIFLTLFTVLLSAQIVFATGLAGEDKNLVMSNGGANVLALGFDSDSCPSCQLTGNTDRRGVESGVNANSKGGKTIFDESDVAQ